MSRPRLLTRPAARALILMLALGLAACGVKPAAVDPPPSDEPDTFPRTYPTS